MDAADGATHDQTGEAVKGERQVRLAASLIAPAFIALLSAQPAEAFPGFSLPSLFQNNSSSSSPTSFSPGRDAQHSAHDVVVVPLADAPFAQMINPSSRVAFDFLGGGEKRASGWLTADAAWLVWDPNWRGDVRSGVDLLGAHTWSMVWDDGFAALAALDTNHDGVLTGDELGGLALWRDENCDGVAEPNEVMPVEAHGIVALSVHGERTSPGLETARDGIRFDNGRTRPLYDWTPGTAPTERRRNHLHILF